MNMINLMKKNAFRVETASLFEIRMFSEGKLNCFGHSYLFDVNIRRRKTLYRIPISIRFTAVSLFVTAWAAIISDASAFGIPGIIFVAIASIYSADYLFVASASKGFASRLTW